jgi:hypothetical protein
MLVKGKEHINYAEAVGGNEDRGDEVLFET